MCTIRFANSHRCLLSSASAGQRVGLELGKALAQVSKETSGPGASRSPLDFYPLKAISHFPPGFVAMLLEAVRSTTTYDLKKKDLLLEKGMRVISICMLLLYARARDPKANAFQTLIAEVRSCTVVRATADTTACRR